MVIFGFVDPRVTAQEFRGKYGPNLLLRDIGNLTVVIGGFT